uniref:Uncharacterized protein n=1 Tax=Neobodo designis TaxID=312471 RepID=A0A7S1QIX4_NEODS|mmetsp:Transcript_46707/g.144044  ORF Transcript_46707/g.144044 Transcript_46707/m.144044 type:complete len:136 (+) Transcript_46707:161-568(+)
MHPMSGSYFKGSSSSNSTNNASTQRRAPGLSTSTDAKPQEEPLSPMPPLDDNAAWLRYMRRQRHKHTGPVDNTPNVATNRVEVRTPVASNTTHVNDTTATRPMAAGEKEPRCDRTDDGECGACTSSSGVRQFTGR